MAVQQNKKSKMKTRRRKSANRYKGVQYGTCPKCGERKLPHTVCDSCGFYNGRQILTIASE